MVAHLDAVTSLAVDPNGLYLLSGSEYIFNELFFFFQINVYFYVNSKKVIRFRTVLEKF